MLTWTIFFARSRACKKIKYAYYKDSADIFLIKPCFVHQLFERCHEERACGADGSGVAGVTLGLLMDIAKRIFEMFFAKIIKRISA